MRARKENMFCYSRCIHNKIYSYSYQSPAYVNLMTRDKFHLQI